MDSISGKARGNRELYDGLKAKAEELEKEFEAHKRRINRENKGGDRDGWRGELYDEYAEKRDARLRKKRAARNEEKLRAVWDELERRRREMQGKTEQVKRSVAHRRIQKFRSFNARSSPRSEEGEFNVGLLKDDEDLRKCYQKSARTQQTVSESSKRDDAIPVSRSYGTRNRSSSSSVAQAAAPPIPRPSNKSTGHSSVRKREKPENPHVFRKDNTKPSPVIGRKANQPIARNIAQTRITSEGSEKTRLAKMSSASPLGYKNVSERNSGSRKASYSISFESEPLLRKAKSAAFVYHDICLPDMDELANLAKVDVMSMMFDEEESDRGLLEKFSKSVDLDPFLGNVVASMNMENKPDCGSLTISTIDAGDTGKKDDLRDSGLVANDSQGTRSSGESDESGNFESTNGDSLGSQSSIKSSVDFASGLQSSSDLKNSNQKASIENSEGISTTSSNLPHGRSQKGIMNGFRRFLVLSKKRRGDECSADWLSITTSEGDDEIFGESIVLEEQVHSIHFPVPAPSERIKHKVGYASSSERSLKANRSFFSLSSFRCKGDDSKPR